MNQTPRTKIQGRRTILGAIVIALAGAKIMAFSQASNEPQTVVSIAIPIGSGDRAAPRSPIMADFYRSATDLENPAPLVVYVPGYAGRRSTNSAALARLARHGYVVVSIDDIVHDAPFPDSIDEAVRIAKFEYSSDEAAAALVPMADRRVVLQAAKLSSMIDAIVADPRPIEAAAGKRIDLNQIGVLGYSFGGATAATAARRDGRIRAIVNLDGWQFGTDADLVIGRPTLVLTSEETRFERKNLESRDALARNIARLNLIEQKREISQTAAREDAYRYLVLGINHGDFVDDPPSWRELIKRALPWRARGVDAAPARAAVEMAVASFFDVYLLGKSATNLHDMLARQTSLRDLGTGEQN